MKERIFKQVVDYAISYINSLDKDSDFIESPERIISQIIDNWYIDLYDSVIDGYSQVYGDNDLDELTDKELKKIKNFIYLYAMKYHYLKQLDKFKELTEYLKYY